ncbi:MAG TPA: L-seryl-tRNA(Sec) selenium transferase [Blastocatellia bacterium]|nr:L-seryl-tRNA(Sec) selenium transferase [Blastocatellia bacterium]
MSNELLRSLPSIERLLAGPIAERLSATLSRDRVRDLLRDVTEELRDEIVSRAWPAGESLSTAGDGQPTIDMISEIERRLEARASKLARPSLRRVINATGVIIHTNLGRAPLSRAAVEAVADAASHYSNLEYDIERGERGKREVHCEQLLSRLVSSEAAVVANNNAAAVLLVLNTLAEGGEVIVSRGELIEIGGSFRIPDVMEKSGAKLREVGTTNRTRISDYERAINEQTRLILRVHPSNYRIIGFTQRPSVEEIADLGRRSGVPTFEDLGSGCLIDLTSYGVKDEPVVSASLRAGISVVSFSGDKMLGGPQAGVIAGSRAIVDRVRSNPLMRALRVDKMTCAALEATLRLYEHGVAASEVPVIQAMAATRDQIAERAVSLAQRITAESGGRVQAKLEEGESVIGGGSAPEVKLPTVLIAIESREASAASIEGMLRNNATPIIARTERDRVLIDLRTVEADEEALILYVLGSFGRPAVKSLAT